MQKYLTVVSAVLSDAKRNEIIQKNPARMIDLPLTRCTTQYIPSPVEIQKLLDALAKEPRHYRMFYLLSMCTGCRRGKLCALKWEDFKFSRGGLLLTISRSRSVVPGKGVVEGSTKNGRSREIVLSSDIRGIFLSYRRRKQLEARQANRELSPYLFTDAHGQLIHPDTFTKRLRKIYEAIGFPKEYHLHTLRYYYVTSLLHSGVDKPTLARDRQDIDRFLPVLGHYKLTELRPEHFRNFYAELRKVISLETGMPLSEHTVEGVHATLCTILSDAMECGFLDHNPAWRTYRYAGRKKEKKIADPETLQKIISALEEESLKYETYFKLIIATGMRRGECCGLQWGDIDWEERSIHIQRNVVKVTGEDIIVKERKTVAGDRYVYFSLEMESLLREFQRECAWEAETYDGRRLEDADYVFRRHGHRLPMTPSTFTWRFKLILKKHGLPTALNVHSLRHTNASLLIAGGADVATVAGLLGHSQPSTTLDIYTHAFDKNKKSASQVLQERLEI